MIDGIATFTIVASTMIIATPTLSIASPTQRRRPVAWIAGASGSRSDVTANRSSAAAAPTGPLGSPRLRGRRPESAFLDCRNVFVTIAMMTGPVDPPRHPTDRPDPDTLETSRLLVELVHAVYATRAAEAETAAGSDEAAGDRVTGPTDADPSGAGSRHGTGRHGAGRTGAGPPGHVTSDVRPASPGTSRPPRRARRRTNDPWPGQVRLGPRPRRTRSAPLSTSTSTGGARSASSPMAWASRTAGRAAWSPSSRRGASSSAMSIPPTAGWSTCSLTQEALAMVERTYRWRGEAVQRALERPEPVTASGVRAFLRTRDRRAGARRSRAQG